MMHSGQERLHALNIEFIHINVCIGYMQDIFILMLLSHAQLPLDRRIALLRAVNKIIMIQNDLFARHRIRDGEEYANEISEHNISTDEHVESKKTMGSRDSSSINDLDSSSILSAAELSTRSVASSAQTKTTRITSKSAYSRDAQETTCPFADLSKGAGTTTNIWAN